MGMNHDRLIDEEIRNNQSKRKKNTRIEEMEAIAREMIGDGKKPNVYFVSQFSEGEKGPGLVLISRNFDVAYEFWLSLPRNIETIFEDRLTGVLAETTPVDEGSKVLCTIDDTTMLEVRDR